MVVLCDGYKLELFDREEDVVNPVLSILVSELLQGFDKLRRLLSPINVWFFYKRRVLRSIDRAFEHEVNQDRVVEFQGIVTKRLNEKRSVILENFRSLHLFSEDKYGEHLKTASVNEVVDIHFFMGQSHKNIRTMVTSLVTECLNKNSFRVLHKIFPDDPRDVNDYFYPHALAFLIEFEKTKQEVNWLPSWLTNDNTGEFALRVSIIRLIHLCLNCFAEDEARKIVLLASNTYKRIFRLLAMLLPIQRKVAELQHLTTRFFMEEFSKDQIFSSPEQHSMNAQGYLAVSQIATFARKHLTDGREFNVHRARQELQELWDFEKILLSSIQNYRGLEIEYKFDDASFRLSSCISFDNLAHNALCILQTSPEWLEYALSNHNNELQTLMRMRSWIACKILKVDLENSPPEFLGDEFLANRFFYGDIETLRTLKVAYDL